MSDSNRHPLFIPLIVLGGLVEGFGLAYSQMARPEIVLSFLQLDDLGLLLVMFGAALVIAITIFIGTAFLDRAPLTGDRYTRRMKSMDKYVIIGGTIFGVGWGVSGMCPGACYASLGIGNYQILWGIAGMFIGAYAQGYWRALRSKNAEDGVALAND
ncbi:DUF6691 family protein [Haloferax chudinovii]|uniref:DUF6691 family protein n=1 Tax=Haloferax chudinovii TaxID=1109010 RepID=A0ABD5XNA7_9EURY